MTHSLARRLDALEAAHRGQRDGLVIPTWLALYRAGASIEARNAAGGADWCAMAAERHRLANETLEDYEAFDDGCAAYSPRGA